MNVGRHHQERAVSAGREDDVGPVDQRPVKVVAMDQTTFQTSPSTDTFHRHDTHILAKFSANNSLAYRAVLLCCRMTHPSRLFSANIYVPCTAVT